MNKILFFISLIFSLTTVSQNNENIFGSFESNSQLLQDDSTLNFTSPDDNFRANSYFQLNYNIGNISTGIQYESYLPSAMLGYYPQYSGENGIASYFMNIKRNKIDITLGYFYGQFGNGLIFRSWENRQLGINNAIKGIKFKYKFSESFNLTTIYGQQRNGFELNESTIQGIDSNLSLNKFLNFEKTDLTIGASYVGRYQNNSTNDLIPANVKSLGARVDLYSGRFSLNLEGIIKDSDVIANEGIILSDKLYDGTALQLDLGYSKKGLGLNTTFRRLENFNFYSDRLAEGNIYNQQTISYTPALTKQQDYLLTNIYVYSAQPRLVINALENRSGEVGSQTDFYYTFKKDSFLGKYKSKIAVNFSYWAAIESNFNQDQSYDVEFIGDGNRYYRDFNFELKNRWNNKFNTTITMLDVIIDKGVALGGPLGVQGDIKAKVGVIEGTYRYENGKSSRAVIQHLWTKDDKKNWAGLVYEYNFSTSLNVFVADGWNYGGTDKIHYYNFGGSFSKDNIRLSLNYGRQRGGLICVGGVCRYVPENTGLNLNLNLVF
ncbi:DUF6029 family protein [Flavobacteriaceae bacterium]|nr:DUF6029 family protein [Flavobacteriaceae bacterium]